MSGRRRYDSEHKRRARAWLAQLPDGSPCVRCGHPMWPGIDRLDLDHDDGIADHDGQGAGHDGGHHDGVAAYLGFSHSSPCQTCGRRCNQSAGGQLAATMMGKRLRSRRCVVCGVPYHATSGTSGARQETCGRSPCVAELKRRRKSDHDDGEPPPVTGRVW